MQIISQRFSSTFGVPHTKLQQRCRACSWAGVHVEVRTACDVREEVAAGLTAAQSYGARSVLARLATGNFAPFSKHRAGPRPARRSSTAQSADEPAWPQGARERRARTREGQSTTRKEGYDSYARYRFLALERYPASSPRLGAHISTFMCHMIANPFTPARTRPERMASSPRIRRAAMATASCCASRRGGARSNLAHGTRRPQHERVQAQGCKVSASKVSMRVCVLVCLSLGRSCPVPGCSSWASRFASRAP